MSYMSSYEIGEAGQAAGAAGLGAEGGQAAGDATDYDANKRDQALRLKQRLELMNQLSKIKDSAQPGSISKSIFQGAEGDAKLQKHKSKAVIPTVSTRPVSEPP